MAILFLFLAFLAVSASQRIDDSPSMNQKTVVVGDEFPSISIRFMNNRTEYKIELNTTGRSCDGLYRCEVFVTLTEMFCKGNKDGSEEAAPAYIEIVGSTPDGSKVDSKWCREYGINEDLVQDEFLTVREAVLSPRGDWSNANATVLLMASFYTQQPVSTDIIHIGKSPVEMIIDSDEKEYEFVLDSDVACLGGHCSMGAYLEINCLEGTKASAGLQLNVLTMNNRSISRVLCPLNCENPTSGHEQMATYLLNMKKMTVMPTGSWKSPAMVGRITVSPIYSANASTCNREYFYDCNEECEFGTDPFVTEQSVIEGREELLQMRCVPWDWLCGPHEKYCRNYCSAAKKFCPNSQLENKPTMVSTAIGGISSTVENEVTPSNMDKTINKEWIGELMACRMYYIFFFIPLLLILLMFFGTVFLVRRRQIVLELEQQKEMSRVQQTFSLLGKIPRSIPYQMVHNHESG